MQLLVTCPAMLNQIDEFAGELERNHIALRCPPVVQSLSEEELIDLVPLVDGWIIGDDPVTRAVLEAGSRGRLRAAVKWGSGVDNIDFAAAAELGIPIVNTPNMFGREVADVAALYVTALARESFVIDRQVRAGNWPKPTGISLAGKSVALVGLGDIGRNIARRLLAAEMHIIAYDPCFKPQPGLEAAVHAQWPQGLEVADFIVLSCALTRENRHMLNARTLAQAKKGVRIVNVARGELIDEEALAGALASGHVHSAALDVMTIEPLPRDSALRKFDNCVFGSHNASNTIEAVRRASQRAIELLLGFLNTSAQ